MPLSEAFYAVAEWTQTVLQPGNATELAALAMKHAIVQRDVAHLVFPDEVQELPAAEGAPARPRQGRVAATEIAPPEAELARAVALLSAAERPVIICGNGARPFRDEILAFAERIGAPVITTFKGKGIVPDDHPLGCGVLGRSGIPVASLTMQRADCLLVLGASFSNHTSIATWVPTIQVDLDRMILGQVPSGGGAAVGRHRPDAGAPRPLRCRRWSGRRSGRRSRSAGPGGATEKAHRETLTDHQGRLHPALVFAELSAVCPDDAVIAVDVGNNTYSFGRFFECRGHQDVLMSGYLGSIGFGLPAALGASVAVRREGSGRKVIVDLR